MRVRKLKIIKRIVLLFVCTLIVLPSFFAPMQAYAAYWKWSYYYNSSNYVAKYVLNAERSRMDNFEAECSDFTIVQGHGTANEYTNFTFNTSQKKISGWYRSSYGPYLNYANNNGKANATNRTESISLAKDKHVTSSRVYIGSTQGDLADAKSVADITYGNYPILLNDYTTTFPSGIKNAINDLNANTVVLTGGTGRFDSIAGIGNKYNIIRIGGQTRQDTYNYINNASSSLFSKSRPVYNKGTYTYISNVSGIPSSVENYLQNGNFTSAVSALLNTPHGSESRIYNGSPAVTIGCNNKFVMTYYVSSVGALVFQYFGPEYFPSLTSISVSPTSVYLDEGDTQQLTVKANYSNGSSSTVTSNAIYSSSNTTVATVSSGGKITAKNAGSTTITVKYGGFTKYVSVYVYEPVYLTSISVSPASVYLDEGDTWQLTVWANYSNGSSSTVTSSATYSSGNTTVATVSSGGKITAKNAGSTTITVKYGGFTKYVSVYVYEPVYLTSISVSPASVDIQRGDTKQLAVTAIFSDGTSETVTSSASYSSSNTTVATVSTGGLVTGKAIGTATITVTYSGKTATVTVNVRKPDVEWITLTSDKTVIRKGGTAQLIVTAHLSDNTIELVTNNTNFELNNPSAATVSSTGLVKGLTKGKVTITARYAGKSDSLTIEVRPRLYLYIRTLK